MRIQETPNERYDHVWSTEELVTIALKKLDGPARPLKVYTMLGHKRSYPDGRRSPTDDDILTASEGHPRTAEPRNGFSITPLFEAPKERHHQTVHRSNGARSCGLRCRQEIAVGCANWRKAAADKCG